MPSDLYSVCGQVRALESKLLDVNRLDRMIGAKNPQDAFRVLVELQYSEYFDESTSVYHFQNIVEQGLTETKQLLVSGTQNHQGLQFLWLRFDLNNLKRALKRRFDEGTSDLGEFTEKNGYSALGNLTEPEIHRIIFEGEKHEKLGEYFFQVLKNIEDDYEKKGSRIIERDLDMAYFKECDLLAQKSKDDFLKSVVSLQIDTTNFRNLLRSSLILKEEFVKADWIDGGTFFVEKLTFESLEEFKRIVAQSIFAEELKEVGEGNSEQEFLVHLERLLDKKYYNFIRRRSLGAVSDIVVPYNYFEERLKNARMIRFVMYAKFHGMSSEDIYNTLRYI